VTEDQINAAMRLVLERMKVFVEPSGCVGLAVVLYDEGFREMIAKKQQEEGGERVWDVGVVFSGGNTTVEAIAGLFGNRGGVAAGQETGLDGHKV
jgi:threonine dehydratase